MRRARYKRGTPEHAKAKTPLAGGYYGVLWGLIGDLDYFHQILKLPHFLRAKDFCPLCKASQKGEMTWCNFRANAPWRQTCWASHEWRSWSGRSTSSFFSLSYTSCLTVSLDYMHVKYLGCDQYQFGAVLELLTTTILGGSDEENLRTVWAALQTAYTELHTPPQARYRYLTKLSMFIRKGYSKLRGKAGELRHLGHALTLVFQKFMNPHLQVHREILLMLQANNFMERLLEENRFRYSLSTSDARRFEEACNSMLLLQASVARHFAEAGKQLFDVTSKCHLLQHLAMTAGGVNPRVTWCFSGEDMMQKMQCLAQSSSRGVHVTRVMSKMIRKYRIAMEMEFKKL